MADRYWVGGTGTWDASTTTNWSATSGGAGGASAPTSADNVFFDGASDAGAAFQVTVGLGAVCANITVSGLDQTMTLAGGQSLAIHGSLSYPATNLTRTFNGAINFLGAGSFTITTNGVELTTGLITFNNASGTWALGSALTKTGSITQTSGNVNFNGFSLTVTTNYTLTAGNINLNGADLNCNDFISNNSNTRNIDFGTNAINCARNNGTVWQMATATGFTYTGTPTVNFTYSGATGTRSISHGATAGGTETNAINLNVTAGTDSVLPAGFFINFNTTGFSGTLSAGTRTIYGNTIFAAGLTIGAGTQTTTFGKTSGTQTITSNGKTLDFPITKSGDGTLQLLDAAIIGTTRTLFHAAGTLDLNDFDLTTGLYTSTGATTRQLDFGTGDLNITGASFTVSGSNFSTAGTGSISMNSASSKTFAGGGFSYPTLNQGGAGELIITGSNSFADITNSNPTASTITLPNGLTTVADFNAEGLPEQILTLRRTGASGRFSIQKNGGGTINLDYISVANSIAIPSNTWYAGDNSVNGGDLTGWVFPNNNRGNFLAFMS